MTVTIVLSIVLALAASAGAAGGNRAAGGAVPPRKSRTRSGITAVLRRYRSPTARSDGSSPRGRRLGRRAAIRWSRVDLAKPPGPLAGSPAVSPLESGSVRSLHTGITPE